MTALSYCPRCAGALRPPGFWSSAWQCERHGEVLPFHVAPVPSLAAVEKLVAESQVPVWVPRMLPTGWTVTGVGRAGDDRTGARAALIALSGPAPGGGPADVVFVAEEPGIGLGAHFAGIAGTDPGDCPDGAADVKIDAAGHPTALWRTATGEGRSTLAGEAKGVWLWCVTWPEQAAGVLEKVALHDLRDGALPEIELVFGAQSPRIAVGGAAAEI